MAFGRDEGEALYPDTRIVDARWPLALTLQKGLIIMNRISDEAMAVLKRDNRYAGFTLLDKPVPFCELFKNKSIPVVQLHSLEIFDIGKDLRDIVGYCGAFSWKDGNIESLDYDSYTKKTPVFGYSWFKNKNYKEYCLDILVGDEW